MSDAARDGPMRGQRLTSWLLNPPSPEAITGPAVADAPAVAVAGAVATIRLAAVA